VHQFYEDVDERKERQQKAAKQNFKNASSIISIESYLLLKRELTCAL